MSDYVERLVQRSRGETPRLRPAVRPTTSASAEPLAIELEQVVEADAGAVDAQEPRLVAAAAASPPGSLVAPATVAGATANVASAAEPATPLLPPTRPSRVAPPPRAIADSARSSPRDAPATPRASTAAPALVAASPPTRAPRSEAAAVASADARQTGTAARASDAAPVIRVHIGRVDVRAAAPPPSPPKRPAEPRPSVALGRYLEDRERRR